MKQLLVCIFIMTNLFCYSQNLSKSLEIQHIDSIVSAINRHNQTLLRECDSITDIDGNKVYKCWNYYFNGPDKKEVIKVSISYNGLPEELCFYYENNKVIKRDAYQIRKGRYKSVWSIYFKNDKAIDYMGTNPERGISYNKIEEAYYFLSLANEYSTKIASQ